MFFAVVPLVLASSSTSTSSNTVSGKKGLRPGKGVKKLKKQVVKVFQSAEDSARFAFAAARGFRFGSDWALTVDDPNPPNQEATSVVRRCGTGAVLKTGIFTVCPSVLGVENYGLYLPRRLDPKTIPSVYALTPVLVLPGSTRVYALLD